MTFPNDYEIIRNQLIESAKVRLGQLGLSEAKRDYSEVINSKRRSSCIRNFEELLSVLEKRGHVGGHSIQGLRTISNKLNDAQLDRIMSHYEEILESHPRLRTENINQYAVRRSPAPSVSVAGNARCSSVFSVSSSYDNPSSLSRSSSYETPPSSFYNRHRTDENCEFQIPENVIALICDGIGKQWMEMARKLGVREGEIDSINDKYSTNLKTKAREVLKLFQQRTDPAKWQVKLLDGLVQARRRDLKESVEEVLTRRRYYIAT